MSSNLVVGQVSLDSTLVGFGCSLTKLWHDGSLFCHLLSNCFYLALSVVEFRILRSYTFGTGWIFALLTWAYLITEFATVAVEASWHLDWVVGCWGLCYFTCATDEILNNLFVGLTFISDAFQISFTGQANAIVLHDMRDAFLIITHLNVEVLGACLICMWALWVSSIKEFGLRNWFNRIHFDRAFNFC